MSRFARALGGRVAARSKLGSGTRFTVDVPTYAVGAPTTLPIRESAGRALEGRVIAVLDDEADALQALQICLEDLGAIVFASRDELHFLAAVTTMTSVPDLILIDFHLAGRTAERALQTLLSRFGEQLNLAIVTGFASDSRVQAFAHQASIIEKPLTTESINQIVSLATTECLRADISATEVEPAHEGRE